MSDRKYSIEDARELLRLKRQKLAAYRKFTETDKAFKRLDKKHPGIYEKKFKEAEKQLDMAEECLSFRDPFSYNGIEPNRIEAIQSEMIQILKDTNFMTLIKLADYLLFSGLIVHREQLGIDVVRRQRAANEARSASADTTVSEIIKNLAKRQDYKPIELWYEFIGYLDLHDLDPDEVEDRIDYIGGSIRYDAFRKRIIRYRK